MMNLMRVASEQAHKDFVAEYKKTHKVLNLQIKQEFLTQIMNGTKKKEYREIRPTTEKKYIQFDEEGYPVEDKTHSISFADTVEVDTKIIDGVVNVIYSDEEGDTLLPVYKAVNEEGEEYEAVEKGGIEFAVIRATYDDGTEAVDENGNPIMAVVTENRMYGCTPIKYDAINFYIGNKPDTDHALVEVTGAVTEFYTDEEGQPVCYDYEGEDYFIEQIIYDLGEIICEYKA